jgi:Ricin-type beta-trefoil lectin domain-like
MQSNACRKETFYKLLTSLVTGVLFAALGACSSQANDAVSNASPDDGAYADAGSEATSGDADLSDDGMAESDVDVEASSEAGAPDSAAPLSDGDYIIRAVHRDLCLDVPGGSLANGTKLQQWPCNGRNARPNISCRRYP